MSAPAIIREERLANLAFENIYLEGEGKGRIHRLAGADGAPLVPIPTTCRADADNLWNQLQRTAGARKEFTVTHDRVRYRVSRIESLSGTAYALRRPMAAIKSLKDLGFPAHLSAELMTLGTRLGGLILVAGATGQGKTTTVVSLLAEYLHTLGGVAVTIEDPVEIEIEGSHPPHGHCYQIAAEDGNFETPLVHALRYTPRYIFVGECRTSRAATQALRAALSGHIVLTTVHAADPIEALVAMHKLALEHDGEHAHALLAHGLLCCLHQTLVGTPTRPRFSCIFAGAGMGDPVRAKLRKGNITALQDNMRAQQTALENGQPLFALPAPSQR